MLRIEGVDAVYGPVKALSAASLQIGKGELVGLLGANNAGKSTLMNVLSGIVPAAAGRVFYEGEDITRASAKRRVEMGIVQVPEGRLVFPQMSVRENLLMGGMNASARPRRAEGIARVCELFPRLAERLDQHAGTLSGGEQQMLAIGRVLVAGPSGAGCLDAPRTGQ